MIGRFDMTFCAMCPKSYLIIGMLLLIYLANSCDHGLAPPEARTGISGVIRYHNWPPADSLVDLRLIVFNNYPPGDIFFEITSGRAVVYPPLGPESLPFYADSTEYYVDLATGNYEYVVVAQQYADNLTSDWWAVGQYDTTGTGRDSIPTAIEVIENSILNNIDINVDFNNKPPQPF
jgi:hypothetical protein